MKNEEYTSLRAEIIGEQSSIINLLIAMYTIFVAIITFAIEKQKSFLFIPAIFITILFKLQLLWKKTGVLRLAAYIKVYYEDKYEEINWETSIVLAEKYRGKYLKKWFRIVSIPSSKSATFLVVFAYLLNLLYIYQYGQNISIHIVEIIFGSIGVIVSLYIDVVESCGDLKEKFIQEFEELNKR